MTEESVSNLSPTHCTISVKFAYDGGNITEELDGGGNLVTHFTQGAGIDEPLALTGTGGTYYYHADGLGSITSLTNGSGQLAASYVYDSFGNLTASTGTITNPFQYTGREFDSETGLYYYHARYLDAAVGRFASEDPARFRAGVNFYDYVLNSPVGITDPKGLAPCLNVQNFVNFMNNQAKNKFLSSGECAMSVKRGLAAGFGIDIGHLPLHGGPQNYGPGLVAMGFVPTDYSDTSNLRPGDVMTFQAPGKAKWGHIQMWNGSQWVSDYMQQNMPDGYPGPGSFFEAAAPAYQLYRDSNDCRTGVGGPRLGGGPTGGGANTNWLQILMNVIGGLVTF